MTRQLTDDLGQPVDLPTGPVRRVVSLVPSLTEAVAATAPETLIAATDWCTHPADLDAAGVVRVRGTKNPDVAAIVALAPDLVIANKEENRELDVQRMRAHGIPVWVTDIETVPQALKSMRRLLVDACAWAAPGWLAEADRAWAGEPAPPHTRVVVPIWRDPWMVVGHPTFTADLLARLGYAVCSPKPGRYPHADLTALDDPALADLVLLPDEPYAFTAKDGPEAFTHLPTRLVSGRLLTWYGPAMIEARAQLGQPPISWRDR